MIPLFWYMLLLIVAVVSMVWAIHRFKVAALIDKDMDIVPPNTKPPRVPRP